MWGSLHASICSSPSSHCRSELASTRTRLFVEIGVVEQAADMLQTTKIATKMPGKELLVSGYCLTHGMTLRVSNSLLYYRRHLRTRCRLSLIHI